MIEVKSFKNNDLIDFKTVREINDLVNSSNIGEKFSFGDFLYVAFENNRVVGIVVYRFDALYEGIILPRFIHIILGDEIKRSRSAIILLIKSEKDLMRFGFKKIWAYILREKEDMLILARKFGFKDLEKDTFGYTLEKKIGD